MSTFILSLYLEKILYKIVSFSVAIYLCFYVLVPSAYVVGPALLLVLSLLFFRWSEITASFDTDDFWFSSAFVVYFFAFALLNLVHGETVDHFDRPSRFLASIFILSLMLRFPPSLKSFWVFSGIGAILTGGYALYATFVEGLSRATTYDNPIYFGNGALVLALLSFCGTLWAMNQKNRNVWLQVLFIIAFLFGMVASFLSGTRGGWLSLPFVFLVFLFALKEYFIAHRSYLVIAVISVLLTASLGMSIDSVERRIDVASEEVVDYFYEDRTSSSVGVRLEMYKSGWLIFIQNPFSGTGESAFSEARHKLVDAGMADAVILKYRHLHNQFIDNAAKGGIIGLFSLVFLFFVLFVSFARKMRSDNTNVQVLAISGASFVVMFAVFCMTQGMLVRHMGVMMFVFVPVMIWSMLREQERSQSGSV